MGTILFWCLYAPYVAGGLNMNVLGVFDGISCGQVALERAGFNIDNYFASENDKFPIKVTQHNYPNTIQLGDVTNWREWELPPLDLIMGGSPCQGFSFAGKQLNFEDPRSKLFFEFVDIINHFKPKYFLLENVVMKKQYQDIITEYLGVEPIMINSNLVSAQNRRRLYWTNIPNLTQPENKEIYLKDIIESDVDDTFNLKGKWLEWWNKNKDFQVSKKYSAVNPDKAICMTARQYANWNGTFIQIPFAMTERRTEEAKRIRREHQQKYGKDFSPRRGKELVPRNDGKMNCLTATYSLKEHTVLDNQIIYRKLTPIECERLQTLPDNYTKVVSNSQRYKTLGNGWTVEVITHILKNMDI